jgi:cobalt-zinc-cadmium efflux system outer membrane protein
VAVAGHEVEEARHAFEAQRRRVLNDVAVGWFETLAAQRVVELNTRLVGIGDEGVEAAKRLLKALEVSRVDVLQAQIEADTAKLRLDESKNRHLAAWRRLAAVIGRPDMAPAALEGSLEQHLVELTWDDSLARVLNENPELAAARSGVARAQCELARQCAERVPNVETGTTLLYDNPDERAVVGVEVGMRLPIFDRNQGNIAKARAELVAAEREVERVALILQQRLATAFARYADARQQVRQYAAEDGMLSNAKETLDLVEEGYEQGEFDYLKLLTAQRTYFRVNLAYLEALLELQTTTVEIDGLLLTGGLNAAIAVGSGRE